MPFFQGLIMGMIAGFPAGPLGMIVLGEILAGKIKEALVKGCGAILSNFFYGMVVAFGLSFVADWLTANQTVVRCGGGLLIMLLGVRILLKKPKEKDVNQPTRLSLGSAFLTGLVVTLTNPAKIITYTGLISLFGLTNLQDGLGPAAWLLVCGIACGSAFWWLAVFLLTRKMKSRLLPRKPGRLHLISGSVVILLGLAILVLSLVGAG